MALNERARNRVTGAVFLFALAVIFFPMLFDGAGVQAVKIPPMPSESPATPEASTIGSVPALDDVAPQSDVVARVEELDAGITEEGFSTATGTRIGDPVLRTPDDASTVWAVQVASFAREDNAVRFREQLRDDGFEAFLSTTAPEPGKRMYRVAVGPLLSATDARQLRDALAERYDIKARIMAVTE